MFDDKAFNIWLDDEATKAFKKVASSESLTQQETTILILKGLSNHVYHLEIDIRGDIKKLDGRMDNLDKKVDSNFKILNDKIDSTSKILNDKIDSTSKTLNDKIDSTSKTLNDKIDINLKWIITTMVIMSGITISGIGLLLGFMKFF